MKAWFIILIALALGYTQSSREYYPSGKLKEEGTLNERGTKIGVWNTFYENGRLKTTSRFQYGQLQTTIEYSAKGIPTLERRYEGEFLVYEMVGAVSTSYVKGVPRYRNGISLWDYRCDTLMVSAGQDTQQHQICGYIKSDGGRVGPWRVSIIKASEEVLVMMDTNNTHITVTYDTVASTLLEYRRTFDERRPLNTLMYLGTITKGYNGWTSTLYTALTTDKVYTFNNSLKWSYSRKYISSSMNSKRNLTVDNCDDQEYMPAKKCPRYSTYGCIIDSYESQLQPYK